MAEAAPELLGHVRREWCEHEHHRLDHLSGRAARGGDLRHVVVERDELRDRRVEPHRRHVGPHAGDGPVQEPARLVVRGALDHRQRSGLLVDDVAPQALEEAVDPHDVARAPRARRVERPHRHLVEPERVRAVLAKDVVRCDHVLQALPDLAELAEHLVVAQEEAAVALDDLTRLHVQAACVGVGRRLDVALVEQSLEGLGRRDVAEVEQDLVPEPRVEQVQDGVLHAADVEVDATRPGLHPVPLRLGAHERVLVGRVEVAQVVPTRPGPLRHRVELPPVGPHAVAQVEVHRRPVLGACERRSGNGRHVAGHDLGLEVRDLGQLHRQHGFRQGDREVQVVVDDRERLAPVALTAEEPVPQLVVDGRLPEPAGHQPAGDRGLRRGDAETVERDLGVGRAHRDPVADERVGPRRRVRVAGALEQPRSGRADHARDGQVELARELEVALVVRRHGHDRTGPVAHEHVVGDEDRDPLVVDGIDRERAGEDPRLVLALRLALELALLPGELAVAAHRLGGTHVDAEDPLPRRRDLAQLLADRGAGPVGRDELVDERVLGRQHHVRRAEQRVGPRREDRDDVVAARHPEVDRRSGAPSDPVPLHDLDRVGPVELLEVVEQAVGVGGDPQHPLLERGGGRRGGSPARCGRRR